ncbi:MAG: cytochrome P450, partial [Polyangiaceae bacterium]|nr:cytochrome P450 [Polyangiaceae bacterium]
MQEATPVTASPDAAPPAAPKPIPKVKGKPIIGSTIEFQRDQIKFVMGLRDKYGDVAKAWIVNTDWHFVFDPDIIHEINVRQWDKFHKPKLAKMMWRPFIGNGVVPNDGEHWRRQHDMLKPGFNRDRVHAYGPVMVEYTNRMLTEYREGSQRDVREDINNLALHIVGKTLFNTDVSSNEANIVFEAMHDVSQMLVEHVNLPLPTPRWWPSPGNRRKIASIEAIENVIKRLIAERKAGGRDLGDVLSTVVFARDKDGVGMTNKEMRDEAMTLIFAGHETTAHAATWTWYLLAKNPDKAEKLHREIHEVVGTRPITIEDLDNLPYLTQVMKESLRLMPSVWMYAREPVEDVRIKDYVFPKGKPIFISPLALNRDPRLHPDPEKFEPERWTRQYEKRLPKGAFVPFAAGPRVCMGQGFAQMEMKVIIGTMIQNL